MGHRRLRIDRKEWGEGLMAYLMKYVIVMVALVLLCGCHEARDYNRDGILSETPEEVDYRRRQVRWRVSAPRWDILDSNG